MLYHVTRPWQSGAWGGRGSLEKVLWSKVLAWVLGKNRRRGGGPCCTVWNWKEENSFCLSLTGRWCPHPQTTVRREEAEPPKPGSHGLFSAWVGGEAGTGTLGVLLPLTSESAPSGGPRSLPFVTASPTHCSPLVSPRVSGLSPFMGDNDNETLANVTSATWDFDDEAFDEISDDAKDFISNLLKKDMK